MRRRRREPKQRFHQHQVSVDVVRRHARRLLDPAPDDVGAHGPVTGGKCLTNAVAAADDGTNPRTLLFLRKQQPALATLVRMGTVEAVHAADADATPPVQATLVPHATVISVQEP